MGFNSGFKGLNNIWSIQYYWWLKGSKRPPTPTISVSMCVAKLQFLLDPIEQLSIDGNLFTAKDFNDCFQEYYLTGGQERANGSPLGPSPFTAIQILVYGQWNIRESHIKPWVSHFTSRKICVYRIRWNHVFRKFFSTTYFQVPI